MAFCADGTRILTVGTVRVWNAATGRQVRELVGHPGGVFSVALSPDGTRIVSGSGDKTLRVWDTASGRQVGELVGTPRGDERGV